MPVRRRRLHYPQRGGDADDIGPESGIVTPNLPTALTVAGLVLWIATQYALIAFALRDLLRRPVVRGGNKVAWALAILAVPFIGPLLYAAWHPGVLPRAPRRLPRAPRRGIRPRSVPLDEAAASGTCPTGICPPEQTTPAAAPPVRRRRQRQPLDHAGRAR